MSATRKITAVVTAALLMISGLGTPPLQAQQMAPGEMANLVTSILLTRYERFSDDVPIDACSLHFAFGGPPRFAVHAQQALARRLRGEVPDWCEHGLATPREVSEIGAGWYFREAEQGESGVLTVAAWVNTGAGSHTERYTLRQGPTSAWYLEEIQLSNFVHF